MKTAAASVVSVVVLVFCATLLLEHVAHAQCPPGTRWSNRRWACVPAGPPPPPPPPQWGRPPPPGPWGCNQSYQNCLMLCAGVPACVNNCNIGYAVCTQGS